MARFEFKPDRMKSGRNQYVGAWEENACKEIDLPFTKESMVIVLTWAIEEGSPYTHQEIAHWCDRFHLSCDEHDCDVAADVDAQWDMYLSNTYNLDELQGLKYFEIRLPVEWFKEWLRVINT